MTDSFPAWLLRELTRWHLRRIVDAGYAGHHAPTGRDDDAPRYFADLFTADRWRHVVAERRARRDFATLSYHLPAAERMAS